MIVPPRRYNGAEAAFKSLLCRTQRGHAALTVGLGPNFVAGETVDLAIQTMWVLLPAVEPRDGSAKPFETVTPTLVR